MNFLKRWVKQEVAVSVFVLSALFIGGGLGCNLIKIPSPISGEKVSGEELGSEAIKFQRETSVKIANILSKIKILEMEYGDIVEDHDLIAETFNSTYDLLLKKEESLSGMWSQGLGMVEDVIPGPWQPAFALLGTMGTAAFGGGYIRKEIKLKKINREMGKGPRGERLPE